MWKLLTFTYTWRVLQRSRKLNADYLLGAAYMDTVFSSRWWVISWLVYKWYQLLLMLRKEGCIVLTNEE